MAQQLKQALINAGIVKQEELRKEVEREKVLKKHTQSGAHIREDQLRIVCDACKKSAPDVERYLHRNRLIEGKEWLCLRCADDYMIDDKFRTSAQSTQSKSGLFRRQYGRTHKVDAQ